MGVNNQGDIIVATVSPMPGKGTHKSTIYILEQHGIIRGQIPVTSNWNVHNVTSDGKVIHIYVSKPIRPCYPSLNNEKFRIRRSLIERIT